MIAVALDLKEFENDVKIYGIQTCFPSATTSSMFENDVKIYGIQTRIRGEPCSKMFENDVKIYGIQTVPSSVIH